MNLRPYQQQAITDLRLAYRGGARAPLLVAATGAGKTNIALLTIARELLLHMREGVFRAHRLR